MGYFRNRFHRRARKRARCGKSHLPRHATSSDLVSLAAVLPGGGARVSGYSIHLKSERLSQLQAYGLVPGAWVTVIQHSPVTIIRVDQTELAMEWGIACQVLVKDLSELAESERESG